MKNAARLEPAPAANEASDPSRRAGGRERQASHARRKQQHPHVLLVDPNPTTRAKMGRGLVRLGVDVTIAASKEEVLEAIDRERIDAVALLASSSDGMLDVVELLEAIARVAPGLAVIARSRTPEAYELFLKSFGFERAAVMPFDDVQAAKHVHDFAEGAMSPQTITLPSGQ